MLVTKWGALCYMPEVMLSRPTPTTPSVLEQCQLFQEDGLVYRMGTEGEVRMWSLRFQLSNRLLPTSEVTRFLQRPLPTYLVDLASSTHPTLNLVEG